jgi:hypothetical protein
MLHICGIRPCYPLFHPMPKHHLSWSQIQSLHSRSFVCGHCGSAVASEKGWAASVPSLNAVYAFIYICHKCHRPTFLDTDNSQVPGVAFGNSLNDITEAGVRDIYEEARRATSASSYTAAVLCCRKLLMHIAVAKGAKVGESFASYVDFLATHNYVPPDAKDWVDHIRKKGNEANHEIVIVKREDAEELLEFVEMLLTVIYVFPAAVKRKYAPQSA